MKQNPTNYIAYTQQLTNRFKNGMLAELQKYKNFVVWKKTPDGKKIPFEPVSKTLARTDNPATWGTLDEALKALQTGNYHGIGFVFCKSDPFTGIDIDHCIVDGQLTTPAQEIINTFQSYTEYSPSRTGIHILIKGQLPEGRRKNNIEIYTTGRYFTLTTRHIRGTPDTIESRQPQLISLYETLAPATRSRTTTTQNKTVFSLNADDTTVITKAMNARNGATFRELWQGNTSGHQSKSEADFTLILLLLYWTNDDQEQTKRLFLQSGLADEKTLRPTNTTTYLDQSITNAIRKRHQRAILPKEEI
jgi:putative DNA primase/helicase